MPARDSNGRFVSKNNPWARPNMAGRPGKHGLPTRKILNEKYALLSKADLKTLAGAGNRHAAAELESRTAIRKVRSKRVSTHSPPSRVEKRKPDHAPAGRAAAGFTLQKGKKKGSDIWHILLKGKSTGKYAMTPARAADLTHKLDPKTGKKIKPAWMSKSKSKKNPKFYGWDW